MTKKVLLILSLISIAKQAVAEQLKYRPKINQNTQTRIEYGCKRPHWSSVSLTISDDENPTKEVECFFSTRHLILLIHSIDKAEYEIVNCKKNKKCCKITSGQWKVFDGEKEIIETNPANLQIDHILPFSYIRLNMKNCKKASLYYNYLDNLKPELSKVNNKKSNILCEEAEQCEKQKEICHKMAQEFDDEKLCEELDKFTKQP